MSNSSNKITFKLSQAFYLKGLIKKIHITNTFYFISSTHLRYLTLPYRHPILHQIIGVFDNIVESNN